MTTSPWMEDGPPEAPQRLPRGTMVDVCVVGAGIAGLSTAYQLARAGLSVIVVDDRPIGCGETGRTSAHLSSALDDRYAWLERMHGREGARLAAESHAAAIDFIEAVIAEENIACDFARVPGYLFAAPGEPEEELDRELEAAQRAGVEVERQGESCFTFYDTGPCLRFARQAVFHPVRYLQGLARAVRRWGGNVYTGLHAAQIEGGSPCRVFMRDGREVLADRVVVATNVPVHARFAIHSKQAAYRTYLVSLEVPAGAIPNALYWDTGDPYHYLRLAPAGPGAEQLMVGGEDHRTGQASAPEDRWDRLEEWTRARFPMAGRVLHRWSGQIIEPVDGLAYIGESPGLSHPGVYLVTGDSGNGLTHGTIAGILLRDLITGRENPWADLYAPGRVSLRALGEIARDNLNIATQYAHWLEPSEVSSVDDIEPGEGALVRHGMRILAVYRDGGGELHRLSAVCQHLGCIVAWNSSEKTWDCPCHGSRYDRLGHVINGPARSNLVPAAEGEDEEYPPSWPPSPPA
ncbi:MAG TPA: FAD-dependent oxidoreductase [Kofleriaceae bacterium]|nr:FAD-dependent oxidoreductase [Kofleriaceae bacterium]